MECSHAIARCRATLGQQEKPLHHVGYVNSTNQGAHTPKNLKRHSPRVAFVSKRLEYKNIFSHLESAYHFDSVSLRALGWVFSSFREPCCRGHPRPGAAGMPFA